MLLLIAGNLPQCRKVVEGMHGKYQRFTFLHFREQRQFLDLLLLLLLLLSSMLGQRLNAVQHARQFLILSGGLFAHIAAPV